MEQGIEAAPRGHSALRVDPRGGIEDVKEWASACSSEQNPKYIKYLSSSRPDPDSDSTSLDTIRSAVFLKENRTRVRRHRNQGGATCSVLITTNLNKATTLPCCHSERSRGIVLVGSATTLDISTRAPLKSRAAGEGSALSGFRYGCFDTKAVFQEARRVKVKIFCAFALLLRLQEVQIPRLRRGISPGAVLLL